MPELLTPYNLDLCVHGACSTLLLKKFDEPDPNRLALRGYDPQRQAFVGVSVVFPRVVQVGSPISLPSATGDAGVLSL